MYLALGELEKAAKTAEDALAYAQKASLSRQEISLCYSDLTRIYMTCGKLDKAETLCLLSLQQKEREYGTTHPYYAYGLRMLAEIYLGQMRSAAAQKTLDQAISIMLEYHQPDEQVLAPFYVERAKICVQQKQYLQAENLYLQAYELILESYGPDHLYTAEVQNEIGRLYLQMNNPRKAQEMTSRAQATINQYSINPGKLAKFANAS